MDLAESDRQKPAAMQTLFYREAASNDVLPIHNSKTARLDPAIRPSLGHPPGVGLNLLIVAS